LTIDQETQQVYELQANLLRVLANSKRLMIMKILSDGQKTVGEIASALDMTLQNTSQHLRVMKDQGIVSAQREGQSVIYRLTNPVFSECCELVRKALTEEVRKKGQNLDRIEAVR
jgi:ArsR family transcriptional regulator, virulence genes transcriptional regulator